MKEKTYKNYEVVAYIMQREAERKAQAKKKVSMVEAEVEREIDEVDMRDAFSRYERIEVL
jgi:predicted oxidoreductase